MSSHPRPTTLATPRTSLEGVQTTLRFEPFGRQHTDALESILTDAEAIRFTRLPDPVPAGFAEGWVARYEQGRRDGTTEGFAVVTADGAFAGLALAPDIDRAGRQVELGYIIAPSARGQGVATATLRWLTRWAFEELGVLRAYLIIDRENQPSARVARRCGYVLEGVLRSLHLKQEIRIDAEIWSRLPTDP